MYIIIHIVVCRSRCSRCVTNTLTFTHLLREPESRECIVSVGSWSTAEHLHYYCGKRLEFGVNHFHFFFFFFCFVFFSYYAQNPLAHPNRPYIYVSCVHRAITSSFSGRRIPSHRGGELPAKEGWMAHGTLLMAINICNRERWVHFAVVRCGRMELRSLCNRIKRIKFTAARKHILCIYWTICQKRMG